jgi:hypothetical protein
VRKTSSFAIALAVASSLVVFGATGPAAAAFEVDPTVTGYVYSANGTPLAGIDVGIITPGSPNDDDPWPTDDGAARTNASGEYVIQGHQGFYGSLEFYDTNHVYATAFLGGAQFFADATKVDSTTATATVSEPAMTMQVGGTISTTVTNPDGAPATDFGLSVYAKNSVGSWQLTDQASMSTTRWFPWFRYGDVWQTPALPAGEYRICVRSYMGENQCEGNTASPGTSSPVEVVAGTTTEADFALQDGNALTGTIETSTGARDSYGTFDLSWLNPDTNAWEDLGTQRNNNGNSWIVSHLRPGLYRISLPGAEPEAVYYPDGSTLDADATISVVAGQTNPAIRIVELPLPTPAATTTTVSLSSTAATYGHADSITVTATVSAPGTSAVPDGSVTVYVGGAGGGVFTLPLVAGSASMKLPTDVGAGTHYVSAQYGGSGDAFVESLSPQSAFVIRPIAVAVTVALSAAAAPFGKTGAVVATARVTAPGSSAIPDGAVNIEIDGRSYTSGSFLPLDSVGGTASVVLPANLGVGSHQISAEYVEDREGDYVESSTTPVPFSVSAAPVSIAVRTTNARIRGLRAVTFIATVAQPGGHAVGTIQIFSGSTLVARGSVVQRSGDSGFVQLTWMGASAGRHTLSARFTPASGARSTVVHTFTITVPR